MAAVKKINFSGRLWIWPMALVAGILAYWFTRGPDGELLASLAGFGVWGIIYCTFMWFGGHASLLKSLSHLVITESVVIVALVIDPELDEMAGLLNYLIPAMVAIMVGIGWVVQQVITVVVRNRHE